VNADNFVVSNGAKQSLFNACFALFGPGDKVLVPVPYWVSYPQMVRLARAEPVLVPGAPEWSMKVSVEDLERERDSLTRGLMVSTPCNPTGAVYTRAELKAIAEWAHEHEIWLLCDEIYRRIHYGPGPASSVLDLPDELLERVVMISGVSKTYAMTGWRIGLALAPGPVAKAMAGVQSHSTSGASQPSQWAAVAAFGDDRIEQDVDRMVEAFRGRRDLVEGRFRNASWWKAGSGKRCPAWSSSIPSGHSISSSVWTTCSPERSPARRTSANGSSTPKVSRSCRATRSATRAGCD
jgi:aspartate aminotransferase